LLLDYAKDWIHSGSTVAFTPTAYLHLHKGRGAIYTGWGLCKFLSRFCRIKIFDWRCWSEPIFLILNWGC